MEITFDKKQYNKYFEEFKRKHAFVAKEAVSYSIESYDTIKIYLESGDSILYNVNNDTMDYIYGEIKEQTEKRKVGRPSKFIHGSVNIGLRVDQLEKDKLQALSDYYKKSTSDIMRDLINDRYNEIYKK